MLFKISLLYKRIAVEKSWNVVILLGVVRLIFYLPEEQSDTYILYKRRPSV